ncbi:MAG: sulfatase-like hydrolase/transferase [Candidatus Eisenbacteria bacterium]|nr:sulfatase-like hydrolase/transferase [Candidatus Eisenbacteria bacterium]
MAVILLVASALSVMALRGGFFARVFAGPSTESPNVVIVVMDTARRDRLSCYGYERDTSPNLRELAETSTLFERAHSTSSWTNPAHATLFTGLYPVSHKVTQEHWKMSPELTTLAEIMSEHGYQTAGIVENAMLSSEHGFAQGFSSYRVIPPGRRVFDRAGAGSAPAPGNRTTDLFERTLGEMNPERPFFVFVNLIAPHQPYDSSRRFMDEFVSDSRLSIVSNMWPEYYLGEKEFSPAELRHLNELYDAELLYTDSLVGRIAEILRSAGEWGETVFVVTSDHGENIGDHGHMDHVFSLYETTVRIPLIIHGPGFDEGAVDRRPVTLADISPTLLDAAGIDRGSRCFQGLSLLTDSIPADRAIVSEYYRPVQALGRYDEEERASAALDPYRRRIRSITVEGRKLVRGSDGRRELYDLDVDPDERDNLLERPGEAGQLDALDRRLTETIDRLRSERAVAPEHVRTEELREETREALRSLGYLD